MAQFLRPSIDITLNAWVNQSAGTTNLFQSIDETDDVGIDHETDFVGQGSGANNNFYEVRLSAPTSTPLVRRAHIVRYRYRKSQALGHVRNLQVELRQGATLIATGNLHSDITVLWQEGAFSLTPAQAGNISDYTNLRLRFIPTGTITTPTGSRRMVQVSWAQMRVPDWQPTYENEWGAVEDLTTPNIVRYTLDGFIAEAPTRLEALVVLCALKRIITIPAQLDGEGQVIFPASQEDDPVWSRRWRMAYYSRKFTDYTTLKSQIQSDVYVLPPYQTKLDGLAICDAKLARFTTITSQADAEDRA